MFPSPCIHQPLFQVVHSYNDSRDACVYTGSAGVALTLLHLHRRFTPEDWAALNTGISHSQLISLALNLTALARPPRPLGTFFCGAAGTLAVRAIAATWARDEGMAKQALADLMAGHAEWFDDPSLAGEMELLYGRVGYLSALMVVDSFLGTHLTDSGKIAFA